MNPEVSIIIPAYNQAQYLPETLDSVLSQSHQDWECIIVNDGSTDNTREVAMEYCKKDDRFKYIEQNNQGLSRARNNGIISSHGKYILPLDSDDLISKDYLKEALEIFVNNPKVKIVYCQAELFGDMSGRWLLPEYSYGRLLYENMIFCTAMYKREDYNKTNGYNVNMQGGFEDWDFWLSLIKEDDVVYQLPKIHFYYRIKKISMSSGLNEESIKVEQLYKQIYRNHKELYEDIANPIYSTYIIRRREQMIAEKEQEIKFMKSSKFWKLRDFYIRITNSFK